MPRRTAPFHPSVGFESFGDGSAHAARLARASRQDRPPGDHRSAGCARTRTRRNRQASRRHAGRFLHAARRQGRAGRFRLHVEARAGSRKRWASRRRACSRAFRRAAAQPVASQGSRSSGRALSAGRPYERHRPARAAADPHAQRARQRPVHHGGSRDRAQSAHRRAERVDQPHPGARPGPHGDPAAAAPPATRSRRPPRKRAMRSTWRSPSASIR